MELQRMARAAAAQTGALGIDEYMQHQKMSFRAERRAQTKMQTLTEEEFALLVKDAD